MRVWGIDPSLRNTGVAVLSVVNGVPVVEHATVIVTKPADRKRHVYAADADVAALTEIASRLNTLAADHAPDFLAIETDVACSSKRAAKAGGMCLGAVVGWAQSRRLVCIGVSAREAKHVAAGRFTASKQAVSEAVTGRLGDLGCDNSGHHASDAAAVALAGLATPVGRAFLKGAA